MITRKRLLDSACDPTRRPAWKEECNVKGCFPDATWHKGEWSKVTLIIDNYINLYCKSQLIEEILSFSKTEPLLFTSLHMELFTALIS